jgi:hypothetical protein
MSENVYPFIEPLTQPAPVYMHLTDINSVGSFFVFMDAAIKCHPFVLVASFALSLFFIYIIVNSKKIYDVFLNSIYSYNKGGE